MFVNKALAILAQEFVPIKPIEKGWVMAQLYCGWNPNYLLPDTYCVFSVSIPQKLFRVLQQWRNLRQQKWSGQPYDPESCCTAGSLALFCAMCPQPGVNLLENWQQDPDKDTYIRMFAIDGNFSAVHQKRHNAIPESCLTDGELYMVSEKRY